MGTALSFADGGLPGSPLGRRLIVSLCSDRSIVQAMLDVG